MLMLKPTAKQGDILKALRDGPVRPSELALELGLTGQQVCHRLEALLRKGLVKRTHLIQSGRFGKFSLYEVTRTS